MGLAAAGPDSVWMMVRTMGSHDLVQVDRSLTVLETSTYPRLPYDLIAVR